MRKLLLMVVLLSGFASCDKKNNEEPNNEPKFDPETKMYIRGAISTKTDADSIRLKEVVKYTYAMNSSYGEIPIANYENSNDTLNYAIKLLKYGVVADKDPSGKIIPGVLVTDTEDAVLCRTYDYLNNRWVRFDSIRYAELSKNYDTIAYIPNATIYKARDLVMEAFNRKDYERCYKILDSAYVFIPITGAEWRALKAKGEQ